MGCSWLLILGLVLNVAHCLETAGLETMLDISPNITALLGEDVHLSCHYQGQSPILSAEWKRRINSKSKARRLAGFFNGKPFSRAGFSYPDSLTNLTVQMNVSSVEVEGEYVCQFQLDEEYIFDNLYVTVVARPDVQTRVHAETINDTHFQTVWCSAVGGRPTAGIDWLVGGLPLPDHLFSVHTNETLHPNGTSTLSSALRFPTRLQDQESVACVVRHPTLPNPIETAVRVETYTRPNVTIKAEMVQVGGSDLWVVSCLASGGRPDADISLAVDTAGELQQENETDSDVQRVRLPATQYEGHNVTCVFDHPKFEHEESLVFVLPTFYLQTGNNSDNDPDIEFLELREGQTDVAIGLHVTGNVPRYNVICKKDDGPLPESVELVGRSLSVRGPVQSEHAGLYECVASYHHLKATLHINVTVQPVILQLVPPSIQVDMRSEDGRWMIECSALDAVPAANMSWLPPEGVSESFWFNSTSHNGSHSVRGTLLLPACSPRERTAECVINHPAFEEPEYRSVTLPLCAQPNVTMNISAEWKDGHRYTRLDCSVNSGAPAAVITWHVGDTDKIISYLSGTEVQADGSLSARSSVYFLASRYAGQNLTCTVKHPSLEAPEETVIQIPEQRAPVLSVSVGPQQHSSFWLAACDCRGEGVTSNLTWILPGSPKTQMSLHTESEGEVLKARLIYEFPLALHEGEGLTCAYQHGDVMTVRRTVHIPKYYVSIRVLNHTTRLQSRFGGEPVIHRLSLNENNHIQKILLQVEGNVPEYDLVCQRSDGSFVPMDGAAMIFQSKPTEQDEGLYTCSASFYHHTATVGIQVEVTSEDEQLMMLTLICVSSAAAFVLVLAVVLCVCCKRINKAPRKESLSAFASLMHEPGSLEIKKPRAAGKKSSSREDAHLVSYSIIIDVKSTV